MADLIPITATNYTQLREFSSLVNYKLVKLYLTVPPYFQRDFALKQFQRHIDYFSRFKGAPELGFEYYAWLAEQYRNYGELLGEYHNGLRVNSQPAFFLLKAANFERRRAEFVRQIRAQVLAQTYPKPDPLQNEQIFLGERVWRQNGIRSELTPADSQTEMIATFSLQFKECHFDHCLEVTRTLHKANSEFTNCGYMKFRPQLLVTMAEEYIKSGEPEGRARAATLLKKCAELVNPTWPLLATKCYSLLRDCLSQNEEEKTRARCLFFLASPFSKLEQNEKNSFAEDFINLSNRISEKISIDGQHGFIKCYFQFSEAAFHAASKMTLNVELTNLCFNSSITIDRVDAKFSQSCANESVSIAQPITLSPAEKRCFSFDFVIPASLTAKHLVAEEISVDVGNVTIQFDRSGLERRGLTPFDSDVVRDALCMRVAEHQKNTPQSCKILQRETAMSLSISDPVKILTNEIVKIEVSFEIEEDFSKEDAKLTLQCNKESSIGLSKGDLLVKDPNQHLVFNLKSNSEKFTIWMKNETATFAEPSLLVASVALSVDEYVCALRAERRIAPAIPFKVATKCLTNLFMPLSALSTAAESFLLVVSAELLEKDESLDIPLRINRIEYEESASICLFKDSFAQEPVSLNLGDCAQFLIPLSKKSGASLSNLMSVELGRLKLFWSREENAADEFCFSASLGTLQLKKEKEEQVAVTAKLPEVCQRWEPFDIEIQVSNVTSELKRCSLEVETSSDFQILSLPASFSLLPSERCHVATVSYFPVNCGELLLPKLTLKHSGDETIAIHSVVSRSLLVQPSQRASQFARLKAYPVNCDT